MRNLLRFLFAATFLSLSVCSVAMTPVNAEDRGVDTQVENIRRTYREVNERITKGQPCREGSENPEAIFCTEIDVNKGGRSRNNYPAVGSYEEIHRFFYVYGDQEESYPNTLVKATSVSYNASRRYHAEFLFNLAGELIFYHSRAEGDEQPDVRCYFAKGVPIRIVKGNTTIDRFSKQEAKDASEIVSNAKKIRETFEATLGLPTGFFAPDE